MRGRAGAPQFRGDAQEILAVERQRSPRDSEIRRKQLGDTRARYIDFPERTDDEARIFPGQERKIPLFFLLFFFFCFGFCFWRSRMRHDGTASLAVTARSRGAQDGNGLSVAFSTAARRACAAGVAEQVERGHGEEDRQDRKNSRFRVSDRRMPRIGDHSGPGDWSV